MNEMSTKRMGRPPKVSRGEILDAAARSDPLALQLTALAEQLGISVKTVYYYFPTRKALLDALTERAVAEMGLPAVALAATWREVLGEDARWHYRLGASQPGWYFETAAPRGMGIEAWRLVHHRLVELGWTERDALMAHAVVNNWAVAAGESAHRTINMGGLSVENIRRHLDDYADPALVDELGRLMSAFTVEQVFEEGLRIVLAGIEKAVLRNGARLEADGPL